MGALSGYTGDLFCHLAVALMAMVLDSRQALARLEGLLLLDDPRRPCAGHCDLRDHSGAEADSHPIARNSAAAVDARITSCGSILSDVYSLGLLVMSVVGRVRNSDRCRFETERSRSDDRFGRATVGLCMCYVVGLVEPRNIRRTPNPS